MKGEVPIEYGGVPLCGGEGSRIKSFAREHYGDDIPKPLLHLGPKRLIEYTIDALPHERIPHLVFAVYHGENQIRQWVRSAKLPHDTRFSRQSRTGILAAIEEALPHISHEHVIAANTDELRDNLNIKEALGFHEDSGNTATIITAYANNLSRYRQIDRRERDGRVIKTTKKDPSYLKHPERFGLVYAGVTIFHQKAVEHASPAHDKDWSGLIDPLCDSGKLGAYVANGVAYFNVGTPEEYLEAELYLREKERPNEVYAYAE